MLFSAAAESCVRVLVFLAQRPMGELCRISDIATAEDLPVPYLAKRCQDLARHGFIETERGRRGGIRLARSPDSIKLSAVLQALQELESFKQCILGYYECSDDVPCPLHESWKPLRAVFLDALGSKSVADLAQAVEKKKKLKRRNRVSLI
jgi:Rrf2 family transcriptional regulator, iron-sulfur cluster assembly transcription factor